MKRVLLVLAFGGCATDCSDLKLRLLENDSEVSRDQRVGVGLTLYVDVYVQKGLPVNPDNLAVLPDVAEIVDINIGAIAHDRSGQPGTLRPYGKAVGLTPLAAGDNGFVFIADNTDETVGMSYEAMPVTEVRYLDGRGNPIVDGSSWFSATQFELYLEYRSNTTRVAGTGPLDADVPPDAGFAYVKNPYAYDADDLEYYFDLGKPPYTAAFASRVAPQTLTLHVVDATGIVNLEANLPPGTTELTVEQGRVRRFDVVPLDATNNPIRGRCPDRPSAVVTAGTSVNVISTFTDGQVVLEGIEPGQSTITVSWGTATLDVTVDVTAPPM